MSKMSKRSAADVVSTKFISGTSVIVSPKLITSVSSVPLVIDNIGPEPPTKTVFSS